MTAKSNYELVCAEREGDVKGIHAANHPISKAIELQYPYFGLFL